MPSPALSASSCDDCTALRSECLLLRPWNVDDAPALFELARDPRVGPPAGWAPHASVDESRQVIRDVLSAPHCFAAFLEDGGALVGCVGLTPPSWVIGSVCRSGARDLPRRRPASLFDTALPSWGFRQFGPAITREMSAPTG